MKTCNTCLKPLPDDSYHKEKSTPDGLCRRCKACTKEYQRLWREQTRTDRDAYNKQYYADNQERLCKKAAERYEEKICTKSI